MSDVKEKKEREKQLKNLRDKYYQETIIQKKKAWSIKNYKKSIEIRNQEKENYKKWQLLNGLVKEMEKENEKNK